MGNPGDVEPVGDGISEMKINYGPGYRVDYKRTGTTVMLILCGGDKSTQDQDNPRPRHQAGEGISGATLKRNDNGKSFKV
jgi:putative addiction module killer protein